MSQHVFYSSEDEYLAHSLKGLARKFHKYLLRIKDGTGYRYFYSKAQIDAYMKKLKGNKDKEMSEERKAYIQSQRDAAMTKNGKKNVYAPIDATTGADESTSTRPKIIAGPNAERAKSKYAEELHEIRKKRMDAILAEEDRLRPQMQEAFDVYKNILAEYGKGSPQAKKAELDYLKKTAVMRELEEEWKRLRQKNLEE